MGSKRYGGVFRDSGIISCVLAVACALLPQLCAAADQPREYEIKAAFLLNFTKFAEWPPSAFDDSQSPMEICILGKDPFGRALDDVVQGEVVNGHRLTVRRLSQPPAPQTCQVLFLDPELKDLPKVLSGLAQGVLTVSEGTRFLREGGMIALVLENRRVRFDINETASENGAVKLSSKLLSVARSVAK